MARPEKVATVDEVQHDLQSAAATLLTNYRGLSVGEMQELRAELRKANATYRVAKNTLTRLAAVQAGMEGLEALLVGPTALVFCEDDPVGPAKALKAFAKDHPDLQVKGGYLDGAVLSEEEAVKLAELESREELIAKLAGLLYGALANFARLLQAPLSEQARLMQALVDAGGAEAKGFGGDTPAQTAAAPAADEAADTEADDAVADDAGTEAEASADAASADETAAQDPGDQPEAAADEPAADAEEASASSDSDSSESDDSESSDSEDSEDEDEEPAADDTEPTDED